MSREIEGTRTEENLMKAFAGESMARNRYSYYSKVAKDEGYEQIAAIFLETANNEKAHAKRFFQFLGRDNIPLEISDMLYPTGLSDTVTNLEYAINGEHEEHTILYPEFARVAREEGFNSIGACFEAVSHVEEAHEKRYKILKENLENNSVFRKNTEIIWKCRKCGYPFLGSDAPYACPACLHPRAYFEVYGENY